jgi:hypothetical protein
VEEEAICNEDGERPQPSPSCSFYLGGLACPATIGELEGCLNAVVDQERAFENNLPSCESLTVTAVEQWDTDRKNAMLPATCQDLLPGCGEMLWYVGVDPDS